MSASGKSIVELERSAFKGKSIPFLTFLLGLVLSFIICLWSKSQVEQSNQIKFQLIAEEVLGDIEANINRYSHVLYGARGLFIASEYVSRVEWHDFVQSRDLEKEFPGMKGLGFAKNVSRIGLEQYLADMQSNENPQFKIKTAGHKKDLFIITYVEPEAINKEALGYDLGSDFVRRSAAEWAAKNRSFALTKRIKLIQDTEGNAAILYLLPIYSSQWSRNRSERLENEKIFGWIYAPIIIKNLLSTVNTKLRDRVEFKLYDGADLTKSNILFQSDSFQSNISSFDNSKFESVYTIKAGGQEWGIKFIPGSNLFTTQDQNLPWIVFLIGTIFSALVSIIIFSQRVAQIRAVKLAKTMTHDLRITTTALEKANQQSRDAMKVKSEFLANMSHEIRTPLTSIIGFGENLKFDALSNEERGRAVHSIIQNGRHLLNIINDILDFSKIEAGKVSIDKVEIDLAELMTEVASSFKVKSSEKGLNFQVEFTHPLPATINSDPTRLKQILYNLVGNSIKFTQKGAVTIKVKCDWEAEILYFSVCDTGIGLTEEQRNKLFNSFVQADSSTTRVFGGTGLGLVISSQLAEKLGGKITVESVYGIGSVFAVNIKAGDLSNVLPMDKDKKADLSVSSESTQKEVTKILVNAHVLVVEDGPDNQLLLQYLLKKLGAEVTVVGNGAEALGAVEDREFDLILMDMQMPVLDGYGAVKELRARGYEGKILALTANTAPEDQASCLQVGCNDYLGKPFERAAFIEKITNLHEV